MQGYIDSLLERKEDLDEKLTCIMEKLDDIEQYSRRNCLLFTGIVENDDENTDLLILDKCRESMGIELSLQDIDRSHWIGMKTQREVGVVGAILIICASNFRNCRH